LGAVASIVVVAAIVFAMASSSGGGGEGQQAQDFEFSMFQAIKVVGFCGGNLARLEGKPLVPNFWAALCPPCRAEMPQFQVLYEEFKNQIQLVGIDIRVFTGRAPGTTPTPFCASWAWPTQPVGLRTAVYPANLGLRLCQGRFY